MNTLPERSVLRVFISSPEDVRPERLIAERVVQKLGREFSYYFSVAPVLWEREPLVASMHFQEAIMPPRDADIVVVILWSRLGLLLPTDKFIGPISGRAVTGTEWEFEDALKSSRQRQLPDLLLYRKEASLTGILDDEQAVKLRWEQKRSLEGFIKAWFLDQDARSFTAGFREFSNSAQFEQILEENLRELIRRRLARSGKEIVPTMSWYQGSPYRGLLPFELDQSAVFFGRTRARNELRELLARQASRGIGFVLVIGASGSGKSSLVKAGLLADLRLQGMIDRVALVRHAIFRPSDNKEVVEGLAAAILSRDALPELSRLQYDKDTLASLLRGPGKQSSLAIKQGLFAARAEAQLTDIAEARLLLIIDQLEEIFTLDGVTDAKRDEFIAALEGLARSGLVWVIATMRSDFFDRLETLPRLLQLSTGEARYVLAPPEPEEVAQIIRQPAREAGLRFEVDTYQAKSLDDEIREASKTPGALPLLSFLMDQLWQRRTEQGVLTFAVYRELGGLEGALGTRAEQIFQQQTKEVQDALPHVLRSLVRVVSGENVAVSRPAALSKFVSSSPERALVEAFLGQEARLLVAETDLAPAQGQRREPQVRVAHEALLSHWSRAKVQIAADIRDLELLGRLEVEATRFLSTNEPQRADLLLPKGLPLAEASDLLSRWVSQVSQDVRDYVEASRRAVFWRRVRFVSGLMGAFAALPAIGALVWTFMVWRGVQAVEREMAMAEIPAGCFSMGTPATEVGRFDHEKMHPVCVRSFQIGKFLVTQSQWRSVMVEAPDPSRFKGDNRPVEMISWYEARSFAWRMQFFGHYSYRLPTEAEWEYATRAGTTSAWFWGDKLEDGCGYANLRDLTYVRKHFNVDEAIINCEDGYDETAPVGKFKPNGFGLYDTIGNLFQWTEDCFGDYNDAPADGKAAEVKDCERRVVRGGSWTSKPRFTRSGSRDEYEPVNRNDVVGFRLAR